MESTSINENQSNRANIKPIDKILTKLLEVADIERKILIEVKGLLMITSNNANKNYEKSYCMRLIVPEKEISRMMMRYGISQEELENSFATQWELPPKADMYRDPYYHGSLSIFLLGCIKNNDELAMAGLTLVLLRIWNGRITGGIKFCDEDTMKYVVNVMMNKRFLPHSYATPFDLIINYFTPTIYKTYKNRVVENSTATKDVFVQCYSRVRQMLLSAKVTDIQTGVSTYTSGLQSFYYAAKKKGYKISTAMSGIGSSDDLFTGSSVDTMINDVTTNIVMNIHPNYEKEIEFLKKANIIIGPMFKKEKFIQLISYIHSVNYSSLLEEIVGLILKKINKVNKNEICSDGFLDTVIKPKILSSKKNEDTSQLKQLVDKLLEIILRDKFTIDYVVNSEPVKINFRKMIILVISFNLQKTLCK